MTIAEFTLNGQRVSVETDPDKPLLWVSREDLNLTGTKFGCGIASRGACTVHLDGDPIRSCVMWVGAVEGAGIATIEGISDDRDRPGQATWIERDVPQRGYCESGQIMSTVALPRDVPDPTDDDIDDALSGRLCRRGTYPRIRTAVKRAAELARNRGETRCQTAQDAPFSPGLPRRLRLP